MLFFFLNLIGGLQSSLLSSSIYLRYGVIADRGVAAGHVEDIQGDDVGHSLHFMDDSVGVGHVLPVGN